jgi:hypothetical protein
VTEETPQVEPEFTINEEPKPDSDTAFIIVREWDGGWRVITDMSSAFTIARDADRSDVRLGISQLNRFLDNDELVNMILSKLSQSNKPSSQVTSEAVRQALHDRNLM